MRLASRHRSPGYILPLLAVVDSIAGSVRRSEQVVPIDSALEEQRTGTLAALYEVSVLRKSTRM
jgi:hypothetical protein